MKLISMLQFIEEKGLFSSTFDKDKDDWITEELDKLEHIRSYSKFLKQPLTFSMFFPCDENGKYLKEPYEIFDEDSEEYERYLVEYTKSKEKVLFKGFIYDGMDGVWNTEYKQILHLDTTEQVCFIWEKTIEDLLLVGFEFELTEYAIEQFMLSHKKNS